MTFEDDPKNKNEGDIRLAWDSFESAHELSNNTYNIDEQDNKLKSEQRAPHTVKNIFEDKPPRDPILKHMVRFIVIFIVIAASLHATGMDYGVFSNIAGTTAVPHTGAPTIISNQATLIPATQTFSNYTSTQIARNWSLGDITWQNTTTYNTTAYVLLYNTTTYVRGYVGNNITYVAVYRTDTARS